MGKPLHITSRDDWRAWLEENHATEKEIWLLHYKKHAGKPGIPYEDAVEEALCFGWIDGIMRRIDEEKRLIISACFGHNHRRNLDPRIHPGRAIASG